MMAEKKDSESRGEERRTRSEEEEIGTLCDRRKAIDSFNMPH